MMSRFVRPSILTCLLAFGVLSWNAFDTARFGYSVVFAQDAEISIDNQTVYDRKERSAVYFSHENHMETYECLECHHDYQDGENILDEDDLDEDGGAACAACHAENSSIDLKTAYHRQCMGCHRRLNKQENTVLPITCRDCHPRRSPAP